jgi:sulfofructose kinase
MKLELTIPENKQFDVVGLGMNAIDHIVTVPCYPQENTKSRLSHYEIQGGGQVGTGLAALSRLGAKVKHLGKVGTDWQGDLSIKLLQDEEIDVSDVIRVEEASNQFAFIIVNESTGNRTIMAHRHPGLHLNPGDFTKEAVTSAKILYLDGSGSDCVLEAAQWAKQNGMAVFIDVERMKEKVPEMMNLADVIIASEHFAEENYPGMSCEHFLKQLNKEYNPAFCGITLGEQGSLGYAKNQFIKVKAYPVEVVDTTGAGDIYHAAFAYGILQDWDVEYLMKFSSAAAALKCRHTGGRKGAPTLTKVLDFMKSG